MKRIITQREYNAAYKTRDLNRYVVRQKWISFILNMQSFNVHIYMEPVHVENLCIVHVQQPQKMMTLIKGEAEQDIVDGKTTTMMTMDETADGNGNDLADMPSFLMVDQKLGNDKQDDKLHSAFSISSLSHGK